MAKSGAPAPSTTRLKTFGPALLVTLIGFVIAWQFVNPAPPRTIVIATGPENGAYHLFAQRYRDILATEDVQLELRNTAGSLENLDLLEDASRTVDLAFVQGGTADRTDSGELVSLASLYYEPLWIFYRSEQTLTRLTELQGMRLAAGEPGSGVRPVVLTLLEDNFIDTGSPEILSLGGDTASRDLVQGEIDAAFFIASPDAPLVQQLLHSRGLHLMSLARAEAYTRLHHYLSRLVMPEGVIDMQVNIPARQTDLLAPTANLVVRNDFHPALISLLLQAATRVHGDGGLFEQPGQFPSPDHLVFPLDEDARRYFDHGPPLLQRYLPFWTANLIDRLKIMLVPLLTLLVPLFKIMPPAYRWQVRKKIYRWYGELQQLDIEQPQHAALSRLDHCLRRLDVIEEEVRKVSVPLSYADELYGLRLHLDLVRNRLTTARDDGDV